MELTSRKLITLLFVGFLFVFASTSYAEEQKSYGDKIGMKTASGFANIFTSWLEIPKNIINTTNDTNIVWGFFGGTIKGAVVTVGRIGVGVADLITFPLPTKPITSPNFIWQDFDVDTSFGPVFRLYDDETPPQSSNYRSTRRSSSYSGSGSRM